MRKSPKFTAPVGETTASGRENMDLLREIVPPGRRSVRHGLEDETVPPATSGAAPYDPSGRTPEPRASARATLRRSSRPRVERHGRILNTVFMLAVCAISASFPAAARAAEHTLKFVSIDCGAARLSGTTLTMSVTVGQPDAATLTSQRLELIGGIQSAALNAGACNGDERLRSNCRAKECGHRFKAVLRGATPGQTVTFLLDGGDEREAVVNGRGRATVSWCPAAGGKHTASVAECGAADKAKCR